MSPTALQKRQRNKPSPKIERKDAILRASVVQQISYDLILILRKSRRYDAKQVIRFDINQSQKDLLNGVGLLVDCLVDKIYQIHLNGSDIPVEDCLRPTGIAVPVDLLLSVGNQLEIIFENDYSKNGSGLHRYIDPVDECQYLYTQFESAYCHIAMPVFDQPDLRASLSLTVFAPGPWLVVSNEKVVSKDSDIYGKLDLTMNNFGERLQGTSPTSQPSTDETVYVDDVSDLVDELRPYSKWVFASTPDLPPYLFALCAGDFEVVHDADTDRRQSDAVPPMALYYRKSVLNLITADFCEMFFSATAHALKWFAEFMAMAYPYSKLDSILCPEYNWGAMENTGCVTYNEGHLWRAQPPPRTKVVYTTNTIMHEIAHHWFGNLVTMRWWNDLWLNEAFATYMASRCQEAYRAPDWSNLDRESTMITTFDEECWLKLGHRVWNAMREDMRSTTHPIAPSEVSCADTHAAELAFDGISYGKGSQFLRMLVKYAGERLFRKGVRIYIGRYQHGNATLDHFLSCLRAADPIRADELDLVHWAKTILSKSQGVVRISVERWIKETSEEDPTPKESLWLTQTFCENATPDYLTFKLDVGIYLTSGAVHHQEITILPQERTELTTRYSPSSIAAILPNTGMHAYCCTALDASSITYFTVEYDRVSARMDKLVLHKSLVNMVRDADLSPLAYLKLHFNNLMDTDEVNASKSEQSLEVSLDEKSPVGSDDVLEKYCHEDAVTFLNNLLPEPLNHHYSILFRQTYIQMMNNKDKSLAQVRLYIDCVTQLCEDAEGMRILMSILRTHKSFITQAQTHNILLRLCGAPSISEDRKVALCDQHLDAKNSHDLRCMKRCLVARPDLEKKKQWWNQLVNPLDYDLSQSDYEDIARAFISRSNGVELARYFVDAYLSEFAPLFQRMSHFFARQFLQHCMPTNVIRNQWEITDAFRKIVEANGNDDKFLKKYATGLLYRDRVRRQVLASSIDPHVDWPESLSLLSSYETT